MNEPTDLFIRRAYTHKGVTVAVDIDLANKQISLVEPVENTTNGYRVKKWDFSYRGLEYMNGWLTILDAMKFAITEASKELQAEKERGYKKMENILIAMAIDNLDDLPKRKDKEDGRD